MNLSDVGLLAAALWKVVGEWGPAIVLATIMGGAALFGLEVWKPQPNRRFAAVTLAVFALAIPSVREFFSGWHISWLQAVGLTLFVALFSLGAPEWVKIAAWVFENQASRLVVAFLVVVGTIIWRRDIVLDGAILFAAFWLGIGYYYDHQKLGGQETGVEE